MPRPNKYNLQYFPLEVGFFEDHKMLMIEEDYGFKGEYIAIRLLAMVYEQGYYLDWKDNQEVSIAKRIGSGFAGAQVMDVLKSCLKHGFFDKTLFDEHMVLSSKGIQRRWLLVMSQLRRKVSVNSKLWLVSSEEKPVTSEETTAPATFSTQKESKVNEIKVKKIVASAKPPPPGKIGKGKSEETEPYWARLVDVWFEFGFEKFGVKPSFDRDDPKIFKRIIQRLKKRAIEKNIQWNENTGPSRLKIFLETAYAADKWLRSHFLLSNLEKQFDVMIQKQGTQKTGSPPVTDLQYLYERFLEGDLDKRVIVMEHWIELTKKYRLVITPEIIKTRMSQLLGGNDYSETQLYRDYEKGEETKLVIEDKIKLVRMAVIELFEKLKTKKITPVL